MDLLTGEAPLVLRKVHRVLYWGDTPDQMLDFTTMDDTASFTAAAAMDAAAPAILRVSGQQTTARQLAEIAGTAYGSSFKVFRGGGLSRLQGIIRLVRSLTPNSDDPFPIWQGMQYLYCMYAGGGALSHLDNDRYGAVRWTGIAEVLQASARK